MKNIGKITLLLIFLLFSEFVSAQNMQNRQGQFQGEPVGKISGNIVDANTLAPIEYAAISLYRAKDSTLTTGMVTDAKGNFNFEKMMFGKYYIKVSFIGYQNKIITDIMVTPKTMEANVGTIKINFSTYSTKDVVVSADRDMMTSRLDKRIIDVEKSLTTAGGSALEVLQNVPSLSVDADGTITLRGNSNVTILIDGKPAQISGLTSGDILGQIPSSTIEYIEIVTNPSAKYDPDGTSGIINIILKKKVNSGFNGVMSANLGTGDKYGSSVNLNYNIGKFNFFTTYDARFNTFGSTSSLVRSSYFGTSSSLLNQISSGNNQMKSHNINSGIDYYLDDKSTLSFSLKYRNFDMNNSSQSGDTTFDNTFNLMRTYSRKVESDRKVSSFEYGLNYKKKYEKRGQELTVDFEFDNQEMSGNSLNNQITSMYLTSTQSSYTTILKSISDNLSKTYLFQGNYAHPFDELFKMELGFKSRYKDLKLFSDYSSFDAGSQSYLPLPLLMNHFNYKEQTHSVYGTYGGGFMGVSFQLGLRAEAVMINEKLENSTIDYNNNYFSVYPSVHLGRELSLGHEITLSYSRRVDRPNNRQLNPYTDYSDSLNISTGNPYLKPQYINSFEFGHMITLSKTTLMSTLYLRKTDDIISSISTLDASGVTKTTFQNIANGQSYGVEFIFTQPIFDWWRFNANFNYFNTKVEGGSINNSSDSWMTKLNSSMTLPGEVQFQVIFSYNSPSMTASMGGGPGGGGGYGGSSVMAQTKIKEIYATDLAIRKDFLDGRLGITLRVSDIFNTRRFDAETNGGNFLSNSARKMDSRVVFLGITYKLNSIMDKQKEKRPKQDDEQPDNF